MHCISSSMPIIYKSRKGMTGTSVFVHYPFQGQCLVKKAKAGHTICKHLLSSYEAKASKTVVGSHEDEWLALRYCLGDQQRGVVRLRTPRLETSAMHPQEYRELLMGLGVLWSHDRDGQAVFSWAPNALAKVISSMTFDKPATWLNATEDSETVN
ncbi:hypothetical protein FMEXI_12539 [Fusarium mexicanum]|uniref:Uncharacterized protein n=1 Tax=Fusarium mexicanum TaxID=751941 RepID=A0A8H5I9V9_9HYPO|nr:hypothetical protein FMEXI_12539 [Fusarium mexicanum]